MKKLLLSVLLATVMFGGAAVEVTASANAKTEHITKHHAKKKAVKKHAAKKHAKKATKKHAKKVVKKHVAKKTTKKRARKVAKKHVAKKRTTVKGFNTRYGNVSTPVIGTFHGFKYTKTYIDKHGVRVYQNGPRSFSPKMKIANGYIYTAQQGAKFEKTILNKQPLPKDTEYVGFTYTRAQAGVIGGKVVAYAKWVPNDNSDAAKKDAKEGNEMSICNAQGNVVSADGDAKYSHTNMQAYYQALKDYNIKMDGMPGEVN